MKPFPNSLEGIFMTLRGSNDPITCNGTHNKPNITLIPYTFTVIYYKIDFGGQKWLYWKWFFYQTVIFNVQPVCRAFSRFSWALMIQLHALGPILNQISHPLSCLPSRNVVLRALGKFKTLCSQFFHRDCTCNRMYRVMQGFDLHTYA